jgi:hypothetical protein
MDDNKPREAAAQAAFENYDFGNSAVEDVDGWSYTQPGDEWTRAVYFGDGDAPTTKGHFAVRFAPDSATVVESYAMINGNIIGRAASASPAP